MATKGLKYPIAAEYDDSTGTYSNAFVVGKAVSVSAKYDTDDASLYADDVLIDSENGFVSGTVTTEIEDLTLGNRAILLGHATVSNGFTGSTTDKAPYVGFGFYGAATRSKWVAIWYHKVMFKEPSDEMATKKDKTEYKTPSLEAKLMVDIANKWITVNEFDAEADAVAWLNGKAGLPVEESTGLSNLAMSGTGGSLSPAFGAAIRYYTFGGLTGTSFTLTATAAGHTLKLYEEVDGELTLLQTLTSGSASSAIAMASAGVKKLVLTAQETGKATQTTEIIVVKVS
jgi:phi13 family phage major tail protein